MHFRRLTRALPGVALLLAGAGPSVAQSIPSPFRFVETRQEAGLVLGSSSISEGRFGFGPGGGTLIGGRWGIELSGPLGFEAMAAVIDGSRDVVNPARVEGDRVVGQADSRIATIDGRFRMTLTGRRLWHGMAPYVTAGGGVAFDLADDDPNDDQLQSQDRFEFGTSFFGTLGGGLRVHLSERLALRGDAVFSLWKLKTPPGFSDPERGFESVEQSQWANGSHISISTVILF